MRLHVPALEELDYRRKLLADAATMSYNAGYERQEGYDSRTGTIDFSRERWPGWYARWTSSPDRYYAYLLTDDGKPAGEVCWRLDERYDGHMVSLIIEAAQRGQGYGQTALKMLMAEAFENHPDIDRLIDVFPMSRTRAWNCFEACGFTTEGVEKSIRFGTPDTNRILVCTRGQYEKRYQAAASL
jgi:RimJ/RimL family protein N-acetyltransferase